MSSNIKKICIVSEGCYPYVNGGVSKWIQMLIENMSEFEFEICSIVANKEGVGEYKYKVPDNVVNIHNITLDYMDIYKGKQNKKNNFNRKAYKSIKGVLSGEGFNFGDFFEVFGDVTAGQISDLLISNEYYNALRQINQMYYPYIPLNGFYWNARSMLLPLFSLMVQEIPKADIYHSASTGYSGILAARGKYMYDSAYLLTEHGIYIREREEEIIKSDWIENIYKDNWLKFFATICKCSYIESDQVISLFSRNKDIQVELGCDEDKIRLIPNGIKIQDFVDEGLMNQKNTKYINIGAVLRVVPIKDVKTMIESFAIVKKALPDSKFYIMGPTDEDIEYFDECKALVKRLNIKDLIFTGLIDINEYLHKMDIMVLSSISEGQPLAILEGMIYGKPFVSTDVGCVKELLYGYGDDDLGHAGVVVPLMDYKKMAKALIDLGKDHEKRRFMGKVARKRVLKRYTINHFIDEYKIIYKCGVKL